MDSRQYNRNQLQIVIRWRNSIVAIIKEKQSKIFQILEGGRLLPAVKSGWFWLVDFDKEDRSAITKTEPSKEFHLFQNISNEVDTGLF